MTKTIQQLESELAELEAKQTCLRTQTGKSTFTAKPKAPTEKPVPIITPQMSPRSSGILDFTQYPITDRERVGFENSNPRDRLGKLSEEYIYDKRCMDFFFTGRAGGADAFKNGLIDESSLFFAGKDA
jgi:hypothetical protein